MIHKFIIFSDYAWPFCYIGKGIVDELKKEFNIEDEWLPFELHPEVSKEGKKVSEFFPGTSVKNMFANINNSANQYGVNFAGADLMSNTHMALLATEYAKEKGKFHEFHSKVFYEYFTEGKNIGDIEIIKNIAKDVGLDVEEMVKVIENNTYEKRLNEAKELAKEHGVSSTPTFIIDNKYVIVGAQPIAKFRDILPRI